MKSSRAKKLNVENWKKTLANIPLSCEKLAEAVRKMIYPDPV